MNKYIDSEKLKERIAKLEADSCISEYKDGFDDGVGSVLDLIDSLQQEQPDDLASLISEATNVAKRIADWDSFYNSLPQNLRNKYTSNAWREILEALSTMKEPESPEVDLFERPETPIKDTIEVTSRMQHIDHDIKPIAEFILDYASWNLHKDEWNQPVIEVPLFRVLDALAQRGKPYCCAD